MDEGGILDEMDDVQLMKEMSTGWKGWERKELYSSCLRASE